MRCKFCRKDVEKLVDSHIVPRAFFEHTKSIGKYENMQSVTNSKDIYPVSKSMIGWYDQNLVCNDCESLFGQYDTYAIDLLLKNDSTHEQLIHDGNTIGWKIIDYSYKRLSLFFASILWKAGASEMYQYKRVVLGKWLDKIRDCVANDSIDCACGISFILARFPDKIGKSFMADPFLEKKGGVFGSINVYRFYLGVGYVVYIKVDNRDFPEPFFPIAMSEGKPLIILSKNLMESQEINVFRKVLSDSDRIAQKYKNL